MTLDFDFEYKTYFYIYIVCILDGLIVDSGVAFDVFSS